MTKHEDNRCNKYGIMCDAGGKYKGNQDSALICDFDLIIADVFPKSKLFSQKCVISLVADGVSGSNHGEEGSSFAIRYFAAKFFDHILLNNFEISELSQKIESILQDTNNALIEKFSSFIQSGKVPKTTFVGLIIIGPWLWVFNLGDSRAFVLKDGKISQISLDHVGTSTVHEITQALGQEKIDPFIKVYNWAYENQENFEHPVFKKSYYCLICSDGLTDKVSNEEINNEIHNTTLSGSLQDKVEKLYDLSMKREIDDNVSIIAIDLMEYFGCVDELDILKLKKE